MRYDAISQLRLKISELTGRAVFSEDGGGWTTRFVVHGEGDLAERTLVVPWESIDNLINNPRLLAACLPAAFFQEMPYGCKL